ncbi:hypothetical protein FPV67DRAFT_594382 [Lyophyllum atratum]|nr:hypothetical protein FPV67DRAFT_594382 [Lyophyllum atratum]
MQCVFEEDGLACTRCSAGGHDCIVEGRKARPAPTRRRGHVFNEIPESDHQIGDLEAQPDTAPPSIASQAFVPSQAVQPSLPSPRTLGNVQKELQGANPALYEPHTTVQTPDLAFDHACSKEAEIRHALRQLQYEGSYLIQTGFNQEMLHIGQVMEEIHVFLDVNIPLSQEHILSKFEPLFSPFPGSINTPDTTCIIPTNLPQLQGWQDRRVNYLSKTTSAGAGGHSGSGSSSGSNVSAPAGSESGGGGGAGGGESGAFRRGREGNPPERAGSGNGNGEDGDGGDDGGDGGGGPGHGNADKGTRSINIPFGSRLYDKDDDGTTTFSISSGVDIKIEDNRQYKTPPPNSEWQGPWIGVEMNRLEGAASGTYLNEYTYALGLSQVRITGLYHHPITVERNMTGGTWGTIGPNPNLRIGGTFSRTSGTEQTERKWGIMTHEVNSNRISSAQETGMLWKYAHNDASFQREAGHCFESRPSIIFGGRHSSDPKPTLEVEVVMHWSLLPLKPRHLFASFLQAGRTKLPPAFANFFHHVSIEIDLQTVNQQRAWVVGASSRDKQTLASNASQPTMNPIHFEPISVEVSSETHVSNCQLTLRRAIHGRISPVSQEERINARVLLPSMRTSDLLSPALASSSDQLPTPLPSPRMSFVLSTGVSHSEMNDITMADP